MNTFVDGITLLGVPAVVLVPLLVQAAKALGLPPVYAGAAAIVSGMGVAALAEIVSAWPQTTPFVRVLVAGLLLGLAASGAYSQYSTIAQNKGRKERT